MARSQNIHKGLAAIETAKKERELRGLMREKQIVLDAGPAKNHPSGKHPEINRRPEYSQAVFRAFFFKFCNSS